MELERRGNQSTQLSRPLPSLPKDDAIVQLLAKLGVRRQAKLDIADYLVLAEDLMKFDLRDISGGLDDIAKYPRKDGETAFPELPRLKQAILERKLLREAEEIRQREAEEAKYRAEHPEEFISWKELLESPEAKRVMQRLDMARRTK